MYKCLLTVINPVIQENVIWLNTPAFASPLTDLSCGTGGIRCHRNGFHVRFARISAQRLRWTLSTGASGPFSTSPCRVDASSLELDVSATSGGVAVPVASFSSKSFSNPLPAVAGATAAIVRG